VKILPKQAGCSTGKLPIWIKPQSKLCTMHVPGVGTKADAKPVSGGVDATHCCAMHRCRWTNMRWTSLAE